MGPAYTRASDSASMTRACARPSMPAPHLRAASPGQAGPPSLRLRARCAGPITWRQPHSKHAADTTASTRMLQPPPPPRPPPDGVVCRLGQRHGVAVVLERVTRRPGQQRAVALHLLQPRPPLLLLDLQGARGPPRGVPKQTLHSRVASARGAAQQRDRGLRPPPHRLPPSASCLAPVPRTHLVLVYVQLAEPFLDLSQAARELACSGAVAHAVGARAGAWVRVGDSLPDPRPQPAAQTRQRGAASACDGFLWRGGVASDERDTPSHAATGTRAPTHQSPHRC